MRNTIYSNMNIVISKYLELFQYRGIVSTSIFENEEEIFDKLVSNSRFIAEADEARKRIRQTPSNFTDFTQKYSTLIE